MMNRKDFYEALVDGFSTNEFVTYFGVEPADIMAFDYDFDKVKWNQNLEIAYNEYCDSECED